MKIDAVTEMELRLNFGSGIIAGIEKGDAAACKKAAALLRDLIRTGSKGEKPRREAALAGVLRE